MANKFRKRLYEIIDTAQPGDKISKAFECFIILLIILNVLAVILESDSSSLAEYSHLFRYFEIFSVAIFTLEYLIRIWTCVENPKYINSSKSRLLFALKPLMLIDLLAIFPFYVGIFAVSWKLIDLRFVRALRLIRIFRILKIGRYSESMKILGRVLKAKKEEMFVVLFLAAVLLIIASSILHIVEKDIQPNNFGTITGSMWWGITTLTSIGNGGVSPSTGIGKFLGAIVAVLGVGMAALPAGVLASGFIEEWRKRTEAGRKCPHCGKEIL